MWTGAVARGKQKSFGKKKKRIYTSTQRPYSAESSLFSWVKGNGAVGSSQLADWRLVEPPCGLMTHCYALIWSVCWPDTALWRTTERNMCAQQQQQRTHHTVPNGRSTSSERIDARKFCRPQNFACPLTGLSIFFSFCFCSHWSLL